MVLKKNNHTIHSIHHHFGWDNSKKPILEIKSGESILVETIDSSGEQLNKNSTLVDVKNLDFSKVNPVTGPIFIENAEEGDVIEVEFLEYINSLSVIKK